MTLLRKELHQEEMGMLRGYTVDNCYVYNHGKLDCERKFNVNEKVFSKYRNLLF